MIIIGYPGIGKSTLSTTNEQYVDMESSRFIFNGVRPVRWAYFYARMAEDISRQGYRVFVSMQRSSGEPQIQRRESNHCVSGIGTQGTMDREAVH